MKLLVCYRINRQSTKMAGVFTKMLGQLEAMSNVGIEAYALYMDLNRQVLSRFQNGQLVGLKQWQPIDIPTEQPAFWTNAVEAMTFLKPDAIYVRYDQMFVSDKLVDAMKYGALAQYFDFDGVSDVPVR